MSSLCDPLKMSLKASLVGGAVAAAVGGAGGVSDCLECLLMEAECRGRLRLRTRGRGLVLGRELGKGRER